MPRLTITLISQGSCHSSTVLYEILGEYAEVDTSFIVRQSIIITSVSYRSFLRRYLVYISASTNFLPSLIAYILYAHKTELGTISFHTFSIK